MIIDLHIYILQERFNMEWCAKCQSNVNIYEKDLLLYKVFICEKCNTTVKMEKKVNLKDIKVNQISIYKSN